MTNLWLILMVGDLNLENKILRDKNGLTQEEFLIRYDAKKYDRPSVTVDMLIFTAHKVEIGNYRKNPKMELQLLLIKRAEHPFLGQWALPGGFVDMNESIGEAAGRELQEETNLENIYLEQLFTWGDVDRDPRTRIISTSYIALADQAELGIKAGDDAADAKWFTITYNVLQTKKSMTESGFRGENSVEIALQNSDTRLSSVINLEKLAAGKHFNKTSKVVSSDGIAFDHSLMIENAMDWLKSKIKYADIAFRLMPEYFTLSELQQVYEVILGEKLPAAAFRRKIACMVIKTNQFTKDAGHRPSALYKFNVYWDEK